MKNEFEFQMENYASVNNFAEFITMYLSGRNVHYVAVKGATELIPFINNPKVEVTYQTMGDFTHHNFKFRDIKPEASEHLFNMIKESLLESKYEDLPKDVTTALYLKVINNNETPPQDYEVQIWKTFFGGYVIEIY